MFTTRIATTAALFTFGLASFGGAVVAIAAPAHADTTVTVVGTAMSSSAGQAVDDAKVITDELEDVTRGSNVSSVPTPGSAATGAHAAFPLTPANPHEGQGKKGSNEPR